MEAFLNVEVRLCEATIKTQIEAEREARIEAVINAEIDAWWRDLVAASNDEGEASAGLDDAALEDDDDLQDELLLCKGSSVGPSPLLASDCSELS